MIVSLLVSYSLVSSLLVFSLLASSLLVSSLLVSSFLVSLFHVNQTPAVRSVGDLPVSSGCVQRTSFLGVNMSSGRYTWIHGSRGVGAVGVGGLRVVASGSAPAVVSGGAVCPPVASGGVHCPTSSQLSPPATTWICLSTLCNLHYILL